jgi:hypothetical protein
LAGISWSRGSGRLDLDRDDSPVRQLDDQIDLVATVHAAPISALWSA